jgi:hypothetical protein
MRRGYFLGCSMRRGNVVGSRIRDRGSGFRIGPLGPQDHVTPGRQGGLRSEGIGENE